MGPAVLEILAVTLVTVTQTWSKFVQVGGSERLVVMVPVVALVVGVLTCPPPQLMIQLDTTNRTARMLNTNNFPDLAFDIVILLKESHGHFFVSAFSPSTWYGQPLQSPNEL